MLPLWFNRAYRIASTSTTLGGMLVSERLQVATRTRVNNAYHRGMEVETTDELEEMLFAAGINPVIEYTGYAKYQQNFIITGAQTVIVVSPVAMVRSEEEGQAYRFFQYCLTHTLTYRIDQELLDMMFPEVDEWGLYAY